jgi:multimeric flavodoxin WrbA
MKIQITNGNSERDNQAFEQYLDRLEAALLGQGHSVHRSTLREMDLRGCNGCFGCWVKTPGECILPDEGPLLRQQIIQADFHLLASPLRMGFPSALLKTGLDKSIPLIHPYFDVVQGEAHHRKRYAHYPRLGLLLQTETGSDERDLQIVADIFSRAALNMKTKLEFAATLNRPVEDLARAIMAPAPSAGLPFGEALGPTQGQGVPAPARLTLFNGSPRGKRGNTPLLLEQFARGFESNPGKSSQVFHLNRIRDREMHRAAFEEAECVILGFPLYVDSMPGQVKAFIESLEPYLGRAGNPPLGFLVQSGFPEALHSRHVERYLEKLADRLGSPYLGTMLRGGVEGIQIQPEKMKAGLYQTILQLGHGFGQHGRLDAALLRKLAGIEKFPAYLGPLFALLSRTPWLSFYWDQQMKQNGVFERRFAQPYWQQK